MTTSMSLLRAVAWAGLLSVGAMGSAQAGGFARGTAATDLLYEDGNFNMRFEARAVIPHQTFSANVNPALVGTSFYDTYMIPSGAVKFNLTDDLRCAGTYTQNNGSAVEYVAPKFPSGKLSEEFTTDEFGLTCAVRFDAGPGIVSVIGGGFVEQLDYERITDLSVPINLARAAAGLPPLLPAGTNAPLELDGREVGWRAGLAYEIPEYRLRAEILYRSGTDYGATGTLTVPGLLAGAPSMAPVALPAVASGNLPQTVELNLRSGVAEGWLVFGTVRWTDWSVLQTLTVSSPLSTIVDQYQWRDGWTVTAGVVHSFNDTFAGQLSLTWDRGVATGWDLRGETWTVALGGRVRAERGEFRLGVGLTYLDGVETTQFADALIPGDIHNGFNEATDSGYAVTLNAGYLVHW